MLLTVYGLAVNGSLPWTYVLVPVVLLLNVIFTVGLGWMVSAVGVFVRDMKDVATILVTAGIYVLPVVYLPSWVPRLFQPFVEFNPSSSLIWVYQDTFYFGRIQHPYAWLVFTLMSLLCFAFGYRLFQMLKPFFGKVL
jgi:lipopolysaccharide transport system permease protein